MPTYSNQDLSYNKTQVVKCYASDGTTFIDIIRDAPPLIGMKQAINAATASINVTLPRSIDAYDGANTINSRQTIVIGNVLKWYVYGVGLPTNGLLRFQGVIDAIKPKLSENGDNAVEVTVVPYSQNLGDHGIVGPVNYGTAGNSATYVDSGQIFSSFFTTAIDPYTSQTYGYPFTMDPTSVANTGIKVQFAFQNQSLLSALNNILLMAPANYFYRMNMDKTVYFGAIPSTATYNLNLGQDISSMEYIIDNTLRKNVVVVQGKGVQAIATGSSISTYGQRVLYKSDNRITDTNTAQAIANGLLTLYDQTQVRTKIVVPDYRGDMLSGIGYDIETFQLGQTIKIRDTVAPSSSITGGTGTTWGSFVWGRDSWGTGTTTQTLWGGFNWGQAAWGYTVGSAFNAVLPIVAITYNWDSVELELGWRQPSTNRAIYAIETRFQDATMVS